MKTAILLYEGLTVLDAVGAYEVLGLVPHMEVCFVAAEKGLKRSDNGFLSLNADYELDEIPNPEIILIPGSTAETQTVMRDQRVLDWVRKAHETSVWTTSVCSGALVLGAAGLLAGKRATTHWIAKGFLDKFGATAASERFVEDGKIITAAGVSAGIDMALYLASKIADEETAQTIQLLIEYDPQPPFSCGSIETAPSEIARTATARMLKASMGAKN